MALTQSQATAIRSALQAYQGAINQLNTAQQAVDAKRAQLEAAFDNVIATLTVPDGQGGFVTLTRVRMGSNIIAIDQTMRSIQLAPDVVDTV
jgi:hypothetical protein